MFTTCRQLSRACDRAALRQLWKGKFARCMADSANSETRSPRRRLTSDFLLPQASATNTPTVLLILNWTLPKCTARLWSNGLHPTHLALLLPYCLTNTPRGLQPVTRVRTP